MSDTSDDMEVGAALYENYLEKQDKKNNMEEQKQETIFADSIYFNKPHENAPDFVKGSVSFADVGKAIEFLKKYQTENRLTLDLLKSREGKLYFKLNTFVPKKKEGTATPPAVTPEDIPFN